VKRHYNVPSYDASQPYKSEKYVTIILSSSPFFGQKGRIVKKIGGRHPEFQLEMPGGERVRIDVMWTDYPITRSSRSTHQIDLAQADAIIQFLEYLNAKLSANDASYR